jgi:SAM-dependent methyltransferase
MTVPERLRWAVEILAVRPDDRILELGCGPGAAVQLVCEQLDSGQITAIDRSRTAIERAQQRNAEPARTGKARFACLEVAEAGNLGAPFDKVFAINVNLFWTRRPDAELQVVKALLRSDAGLYLFFETPGGGAHRVARTVATALTGHGFAPTTATRSESLVCISARRPP